MISGRLFREHTGVAIAIPIREDCAVPHCFGMPWASRVKTVWIKVLLSIIPDISRMCGPLQVTVDSYGLDGERI